MINSKFNDYFWKEEEVNRIGEGETDDLNYTFYIVIPRWQKCGNISCFQVKELF